MREMTCKPISPEEVRKKRIDFIPSIIFTAINELIVEHFNGEEAVVEQNDILDKVCTEESGLTRQTVFKKHYLDIEEYYQNEGWNVEYYKPAYCETGSAYFIFKEQ